MRDIRHRLPVSLLVFLQICIFLRFSLGFMLLETHSKMLSCVSNGEDPEEASSCAEFYTSWNGDCGDVNRCAIADYASQMHPFVVGNCPPQNSSLSYSFYIRQWFSRFLPSQDHSIHKKRRLWDHMTPLWIINAPAVSCAGGSCAGSCAGAQPDSRDRSSIAALGPCE